MNFIASHDGFTLADLVAHAERHNEANGEDNRDGHAENFSWNCGAEGPTDDPAIRALRHACQRALLASLFASTGTIMLTAGDEFGRSQGGNNNAYCQDNPLGWIDWTGRDRGLEDFVAALAHARKRRVAARNRFAEPGTWNRADGRDMSVSDWEDPATDGFLYCPHHRGDEGCLVVSRREGQAGWIKA